MVARYAIGVGLGALVTFLLFFLMQAIIATDEAKLDEGVKGKLLDFVRLQDDQEVETKQRKPKPPPPPDEPPPDMPKPDFESSDLSQGVDVGSVDVDVDLSIEGGGLSSDGEYLPIVKVNPQYPRRAQTRGIEGYVIVEFVVTKSGAVRDAVVVEASPEGIFDRAALDAALKFKYKPRVVDGVSTEVAGVQNKISFEI